MAGAAASHTHKPQGPRHEPGRCPLGSASVRECHPKQWLTENYRDAMAGDLQSGWDRTRGSLARAWALLPPPAPAEDHLVWYHEFLDHNELELALDALADVGTARGATDDFWSELADAATSMGLSERATIFRARARQSG